MGPNAKQALRCPHPRDVRDNPESAACPQPSTRSRLGVKNPAVGHNRPFKSHKAGRNVKQAEFAGFSYVLGNILGNYRPFSRPQGARLGCDSWAADHPPSRPSTIPSGGPLPVSPSCAASKASRQPDCTLHVSEEDRDSRGETTEKHALQYLARPSKARVAD